MFSFGATGDCNDKLSHDKNIRKLSGLQDTGIGSGYLCRLKQTIASRDD